MEPNHTFQHPHDKNQITQDPNHNRDKNHHLKILDKKQVQSILVKQGLEEKEIKKLLK